MDPWEERMKARRLEWEERPEVGCVPSTSEPITIFTTGWQAWAQFELYTFLKGKGFDVTLKRSALPPVASTDLRYNSEREPDWKNVAEIKDCRAEDLEENREVMRYFEDSFEDWRSTFSKLRPAAADGTDGLS